MSRCNDGLPERSKVQLIAFMAQVNPVNKPGQHFHMFAKIEDEPDQMLVVDHPHGGAWNYCLKHNYVYGMHGACDECWAQPQLDASEVADVPEIGPVQPLNTRVLEG